MMKKVLSLGLILSFAIMTQAASMPHVKSLVWGKCTVVQNGKTSTYKDCKLFPKGSNSWDWKKTGTLHVPGIQVADLADFIDDVDVVILSKGMHGVLRVKKETLDYLSTKKKEYHVLLSPQAVKLYNELVAKGKRVGALIHSTC